MIFFFLDCKYDIYYVNVLTKKKKCLPYIYQQINHNLVAEMLQNKNYLHNIHTTEISTCNRFLSICFDTRETLLKFVGTDHLLADIPITLEPDNYDKIQLSIENIPIELPDKEVKEFLSTYTTTIGKTHYPGIKHSNKFFTSGTRVYQCIKLTQHIPRHLHHFGRYLRICYNDQPQDKPTITTNTTNPDNSFDSPELPQSTTYIQQEYEPDTPPPQTPPPIDIDNATLLLPNEPPETPQITFKNKADDISTTQLFGTPNNTPETHNPVEPEPHMQPRTHNKKIQELLQTPDTHKYLRIFQLVARSTKWTKR